MKRQSVYLWIGYSKQYASIYTCHEVSMTLLVADGGPNLLANLRFIDYP